MAFIDFFQSVVFGVFLSENWLVVFQVDDFAEPLIGLIAKPLKAEKGRKSGIFVEFCDLSGDGLPDFVGGLFAALEARGGKKLQRLFISKVPQAGFDIFCGIYALRLSMEDSPVEALVKIYKTFDGG